jgi:hypothetical protein
MNIQEIQSALSAAPHGSKTEIINRYCQMYNCSKFTIYRALNRSYGKKKSVQKECRIDPENELIKKIIRMKMYGYQGIQNRELATDLCIEILIEEGYKEAEKLTVSTVNRRMVELGFRERDVIVRVEAEYANQQHQLDFSRSKYFQVYRFDSSKSDYILKATTKQLTYKENDTALRTWLVGLTDAYSRASLVQCYAATGESVLIGIEFLNFAYNRSLTPGPSPDTRRGEGLPSSSPLSSLSGQQSPHPALSQSGRGDEGHPMVYLPDVLKTDNGAFIKNESVKMLLYKLGVKSELSKPMKKRGIQKREAAWKIYWRRFELPMYIKFKEGYTIHLQDYNALAHEYMIKLLDRNVPGKAVTRGHAYRTSIAMREQRIVSVDMRELLTRPYMRVVNDDLTITIKNQKYAAPRNFMGKRVSAWVNMNGEVVAELLEEPGKPVIMPPTDGFVSVGDFSGREAQSFRSKIEDEIAGEKRQHTPGPSREGNSIQYLPVRKKEVEPDNVYDAARLHTPAYGHPSQEGIQFRNEFEAKVYIANQFGRNASYADYAEIFDPLLIDTLRKADIDLVIAGIKEKRVAL